MVVCGGRTDGGTQDHGPYHCAVQGGAGAGPVVPVCGASSQPHHSECLVACAALLGVYVAVRLMFSSVLHFLNLRRLYSDLLKLLKVD